jgi:hypothetical protein
MAEPEPEPADDEPAYAEPEEPLVADGGGGSELGEFA